MPDEKHDEKHQDDGFRVIDRRPFTSEGELRQEVVELEERQARQEEAAKPAASPAPPANATDEQAVAPEDTPTRLPAFENLVRMLGSNAAMVFGRLCRPAHGPADDRSRSGARVDRHA